MSKLINFIEESRFMKYKIQIGGETIKINLAQELVIDEDGLNDEAKIQPRIFAFLSRIHKRLVREAKLAEVDKRKVKATRIEQLEKELSTTAAKAKVEGDRKYLQALRIQIEWEYKADTLESILESFKQRANMIQTISANVRNSDK